MDASGRIFVLQNRNAPAKKRSADEPEDENNGNNNGNGRRKHGPCSPETNFTIAASFTLRSSPTAMLLLPNRSPTYPEPPLAPDARARFDRLAAAVTVGRSFVVGTAEGGVYMVAQVTERDWAVLREVQSLAGRHPLTAPVLGAPHENARGSWPPRVGFGPPGPPAPLWPSVAEAGGWAARSGSSSWVPGARGDRRVPAAGGARVTGAGAEGVVGLGRVAPARGDGVGVDPAGARDVTAVSCTFIVYFMSWIRASRRTSRSRTPSLRVRRVCYRAARRISSEVSQGTAQAQAWCSFSYSATACWQWWRWLTGSQVVCSSP